MTEHIPLQEAEGHLAELVERARSGEDIVLTDAGRPVARLVAEGAKPAEKLSDRLIAAHRPLPLRAFYRLAPDDPAQCGVAGPAALGTDKTA